MQWCSLCLVCTRPQVSYLKRKKKVNTSVYEDLEELKPSYISGEAINDVFALENSLAVSPNGGRPGGSLKYKGS